MLNLNAGVNILPQGSYGDLYLANKDTIIIKAYDNRYPPVFDSIILDNCHAVNFEGLRFKWTASIGAPSYTCPNEINGDSSDIQFTDCTRVGSVVDGVPIGRGMMIGSRVSGVKFIRDTAKNWESILLNFASAVSIERAHWTNTSGDIIQCNGVQGFSLTNSLLGYFRIPLGSQAHVDFFQLQMYEAIRQAKDIVIDNCVLHSGSCRETAQALFFGHEDLFKVGATTRDLKTENVRITNNTIYAGHTHGISLYGVKNADVGFNSLIYNSAVVPDGFSPQTYWPGIDQTYCEGLSVHDNIAASCPPGENNLIVLPKDYPSYFDPIVSQPNCPPAFLRASKTSPIQTRKLGSGMVRGQRS